MTRIVMERREFLRCLFAGAFGAGTPWRSGAIKRYVQENRKQALERFPLKRIETTGDKALAKWQELKSAGQGSPVVLGDDQTHPFDNLLTPFGPSGPNVPPPSSVEEIIRVAAGIRFPDDLAQRKKADSEASLKRSKADLAANPTCHCRKS